MSESILTPVFRLSYPQLFEAKSYQKGPLKFSAVMLFDEEAQKTPEFQALKAAVEAAILEKYPNGKIPSGFRSDPFRKGEEKADKEGYGPGIVFIKASAIEEFHTPPVVDRLKQPIIDRRDVYAGCYCRASVNAFTYDNIGTGVTFGLRAIQKVADGPAFGGGGAELFDELPPVETTDAAPAAQAGDNFLQ